MIVPLAFRPLDDIFDEAASKVVQGSTTLSQEDIMSLTRYGCVADALKRACDFKVRHLRLQYS